MAAAFPGAVALMICSPAGAAQFTQDAAPQKPKPVDHKHPHRAAQNALVQEPAAPVQANPAPEMPNWPANDTPAKPEVTWDSHGLRIEATNSSLHQILDDVATATGAKLEGMGTDERVFGDYGPGPARDVISQVLHGSGYNVLMIGDQGQGTPRQIVLSTRRAPSNNPAANRQAQDNSDDEAPEPPEPEEQAPQPPQLRPPMMQQGAPGVPRTPQQMLQELQQRQQQMQDQQQQQQPH